MQVKTNPNVVSNTLHNTTQYSIKASAKAFKILSDGLYSDKIGWLLYESYLLTHMMLM